MGYSNEIFSLLIDVFQEAHMCRVSGEACGYFARPRGFCGKMRVIDSDQSQLEPCRP